MTPIDETKWSGSWGDDVVAKRAAWAQTTPAQRLAWLESALTFAASVGALRGDRLRRAKAAAAWEESLAGTVRQERK